MAKKFKKFPKKAAKPKKEVVVEDVDGNLPFEGADEFDLADFIQELDPDEYLYNPNKKATKRKNEDKEESEVIKKAKKDAKPDVPKQKKGKKNDGISQNAVDTSEPKKETKKSNVVKNVEIPDAPLKEQVKQTESKKQKKKNKAAKIVAAPEVEALEAEAVPQKKGKKSGVVDPSALKLDLSAWDKYFLPNEVLDGLRKMRYLKPTEIQDQVLPEAILKRMDILGAAETGSGKTMAFCIPIAARLMQTEQKDGLRALILAPTRELVVQIKTEMEKLLEFTPYTVISLIGGLNEQKQERMLKWKPQVIVASPGRFWALAENNVFLKQLESLDFLVIDEMDRMVETGHFVEMEKILMRIHGFQNKALQTMVFSATLSYVHLPAYRPGKHVEKMTKEEKIERMIKIGGLKAKHKVIDLNPDFSTPKTLTEMRINCEGLLDKDAKVYYLLNRHKGRTLVFANSIDASKRLANLLKTLQVEPTPQILHAKMQQRARLKHLERFAGTENSVLIATDVAARGLDIKNIENVVHYQIPRTAEGYIHRSGRTARISKDGVAILMVDPKEILLYKRVCSNLHRETDFPSFYIDSDKLYQACKDRVEAATRVEQIDFQLSKYCGEKAWEEKAASDALIEIKGKTEEEQEEIHSLQRQRKAASKALKAMLNQPLPAKVLEELTAPKNENRKQIRLWGGGKKR